MQLGPVKRTYSVELEYRHGLTKSVRVKATSMPKAEIRALKENPSALRVKR